MTRWPHLLRQNPLSILLCWFHLLYIDGAFVGSDLLAKVKGTWRCFQSDLGASCRLREHQKDGKLSA